MKSSVETLSPTRVKLTIEVPFAELSESLTAAYRQIAGQVNVPGFRKGKVPSRVIDQRFGRQVVLDEAVNVALPKAYDAAIKEHALAALGPPEVDVTTVEDGQPLSFTAEVDVRPDFELPDFADIEVQVEDLEITEDKIDEQLDGLRKRFATANLVTRPAAEGDLVLVDVDGVDNGTKVAEYSAQALSYEAGSAGMVKGADEAIIGLSENESATFSFTPDDGEYADKELDITVTVKGVRERELPEADDDFAQLVSEFDTLAELRADLADRIGKSGIVEQGHQAREKVLEKLLELVDVPVPKGVLAARVEEHFADGHGGLDDRSEVEEHARRSMRTHFLLDKVADTEKLTVGQAELAQWLASQAGQVGMTGDQFADALVKAGQVPSAVADVRRRKALALILAKAVVTDMSGRPVNLSTLNEEIVEADSEAAAITPSS